MADHYVDSAAAGGGDGTEGTPWNTLAQVNAHTFSAGDNIWLKRGSLFRASLSVNYAGSSGSPITYGAYGSGDRPKVSGADLVATWTLHSGSIYSAACATEPKVVLFDGTVGSPRAAHDSCTAQYDWAWESGTLYTYAPSDPDTLYTAPGVEAAKRSSGITTGDTTARDWISLQNLHVYGINDDENARGAIYSRLAAHWTTSGVLVEKSAVTAYQGSGPTYHTVTNCTFTGIRAMTLEKNGIYLYYYDSSHNPDNNTITQSTIQYWNGYAVDFRGYGKDARATNNTCSSNNLSHSETGCYLHFCDSSMVEDNTCDDNLAGGYAGEEYGLAIETGSGNTLRYNHCINGRVGLEIFAWTGAEFPDDGPSDNNYVHHNEFAGNSENGVTLTTGNIDGTRLENNLIVGNHHAGVQISDGNTGYESTNCTFLHNTAYGNNTDDAGYADIYFGKACAGWAVRNNAFSNPNRLCWRGYSASFAGVHSNNTFYRESGNVVDDNGTTYTAATVTSFEATASGADPLFVTPGSDFSLQAGSPCRDTGATGLGVTTDYADHARDATPDRGAYEYITPSGGDTPQPAATITPIAKFTLIARLKDPLLNTTFERLRSKINELVDAVNDLREE